MTELCSFLDCHAPTSEPLAQVILVKALFGGIVLYKHTSSYQFHTPPYQRKPLSTIAAQ